MEIALNELSLEEAPTLDKLKERIDVFIKLILEVAYVSGQESIIALRTLSDFTGISLYPGTSIYNLSSAIKIDKDDYSFLLGLLTQKPYLDYELNDNEQSLLLSCEVKFQENSSKGLLFAYKQKGLAISWSSSDTWDSSSLEVNVLELIKDGDTLEYAAQVKHASNIENLDLHRAWLSAFKISILNDGGSLISNKETLFPLLKFLGNTETQIQGFNSGDKKWRSLVLSLITLQDYCKGLGAGDKVGVSALRNFGFSFRPDSEATLSKYSSERKYISPVGAERIAKWHFDINPGNWRGYIDWDEQGKEIWLTYIGPHLKTKEFN